MGVIDKVVVVTSLCVLKLSGYRLRMWSVNCASVWIVGVGVGMGRGGSAAAVTSLAGSMGAGVMGILGSANILGFGSGCLT